MAHNNPALIGAPSFAEQRRMDPMNLDVGTAVVTTGRYSKAGLPLAEQTIGVVEQVNGDRRLVRWSGAPMQPGHRRWFHLVNLRPAVD